MGSFKRWLAVAAVAVGFAGTAAAADPVKAGFFPGGGFTPKPFPTPFPTPFPNPGPFPPPRVDFDFVVLYKPSAFFPPRVYGKFETFHRAQAAAFRLEAFGYAVKVVPVRDYNSGFAW